VTFLFVCDSNISGIAERICAKFTVKACLVPSSDEFECQSQRLKVKVTRDKKMRLALPSPPVAYEGYAIAANRVQQRGRHHCVAAGGDFGGLHAVYVW